MLHSLIAKRLAGPVDPSHSPGEIPHSVEPQVGASGRGGREAEGTGLLNRHRE